MAITPELIHAALKPSERTQYVALLTLLDEKKVLNDSQQKKFDKYEAKMEEYAKRQEGAAAIPDVLAPDSGTEKDDIGIPLKMRVKRRYTMSPEALAQRRAAASSPAKAAGMEGNRNNWKHGHYAQNFINQLKPCKSTCPQYPCSLVEGGEVEPGDDCLDKVDIITFFRSIHDAIGKKDIDSFNELASLQIANTMKVIDMLQADIIRDGSVVLRERFDKDGHITVREYVPHPSLLALPKLIADLGLNPAEFLITPRAKKRADSDEEMGNTLAEMMSRAGRTLKNKRAASSDRGKDE